MLISEIAAAIDNTISTVTDILPGHVGNLSSLIARLENAVTAIESLVSDAQAVVKAIEAAPTAQLASAAHTAPQAIPAPAVVKAGVADELARPVVAPPETPVAG